MEALMTNTTKKCLYIVLLFYCLAIPFFCISTLLFHFANDSPPYSFQPSVH